MTFLKPVELAFRRAFIRVLGRVAGRNGRGTAIPDAAKVLLLRQDRIGDVLVSTALIHALAKAKPHWQLHMLFGKRNRDVLEHDRVIARRWVYDKNIVNTVRLVRSLRAERFDAVIDLLDTASATSTALLVLAGGRVNVGLRKENGLSYDIPVPMRSRESTHIVDRLGDVLRALGCAVRDEDLRLTYTPSPSARERASGVVASHRTTGKRICCVNTSAGSESRFWGVERYRAFLTEAVGSLDDMLFVVAAEPADVERANDIVKGIEGVRTLPASASFDEFAALVEGVDIVVSPDTAVVHLASALGKATVALFMTKSAATNWAPYGVPSRCVVAHDGAMASIEPHDVVAALRSLTAELGDPELAGRV